MHGGKRERAGRKKGIQNKVNAQVREQALTEGEAPLNFMLAVMRDERQPLSRRADMAKAAAPYLHPRLQAVTVSNNDPPKFRSIEVVFVDKVTRPDPPSPAPQIAFVSPAQALETVNPTRQRRHEERGAAWPTR